MPAFQPAGSPTMCAYLVHASGTRDFIEFAKTVVGATEIFAMPGENGVIHHAELQIGDSRLMCADGGPEHKGQSAMLHVYVPDVDATYQLALAHGATSTREPADQFYGDRNAGVTDPFGNSWYFATHVETVTAEEMARRAAAATG